LQSAPVSVATAAGARGRERAVLMEGGVYELLRTSFRPAFFVISAQREPR
jgi:hypothetical protein